MIRRRSNFSALARGLSYIFRLGCRFSRRFGVNKVGDYLMNDVSWDSAQTQRLLQRAQTGDRQAFEELFARHRLYLRQLVELRLDPRLRTRIDPSDVVQEAHLEAFRRMNTYLQQRPMPFRLWLRQIAYDRTLKARRHHLGTARRAVNREVSLPELSSLFLAQQLLGGDPTPSQLLEHR